MPISVMAVTNAKSYYWEVFAPMPTRRVYCTPVYDTGLLYVVGGCSETGLPLDTTEVLDMASQTWTTLPPLPTPRAGAAVVLVGKQLHVIGGMDGEQRPLSSVEIYNSDEGRWEKKANLGQPSMGITALETGGRQGKLPVTAFEAFDLEVKSWTRYPSIPSRRAFACCAMTDKCFFSLGGLQQPGPHNFYSRPHFVSAVEVFDTEQGVWSKPTRTLRMREKRADFVAGYLGGRVIAVGGLGNQPSPLSSVEGYNPGKRKWEYLAPMPSPRCSCAGLQTEHILFVIGGVAQGPSNAVEGLCIRECV
ncbi:kelch domain-containing protein 8B-like isoform X2 [Erpetoichthys calabaricus]|uniref:kelch domain-containing protein 8B-like isoform X2 n=1 Tax=Erpetoichthys calabaricus TaxID=27687 RepID=UPI0022349A51|nr:kelch domain-containing protein 8B-like isoform X2 [Erpetoichthys calabaricus]